MPRPRPRKALCVTSAALVVSLVNVLSLANPAVAATPTARGIDDSCPAVVVQSRGFVDIDPDGPFTAYVDCLAHWQVSTGVSTTHYAPTQAVTREHMAGFISRLILRSGGTLPASPPDAFNDTAKSGFEHAINQLAAVDIVLGVGEGRYGPADPVRRDQMAAFLVRAHDYRAAQGGVRALTVGSDYFADDDGSSLESQINSVAAAGFAAGEADGTYRPGAPVQRQQMAAFLTRVLDLMVEDGLSQVPPADAPPTPDTSTPDAPDPDAPPTVGTPEADSPSPPVEPEFTFTDGSWSVGSDVPAGLYRSAHSESCYWERASDHSGQLPAILGNDLGDGPVLVQILGSDARFGSENCGTWESVDVSAANPSTAFAGNGDYLVGVNIAAGTYRSDSTGSCYWERGSSALGNLNSMIDNGYGHGPATATISADDFMFSSSGCGSWRRVS